MGKNAVVQKVFHGLKKVYLKLPVDKEAKIKAKRTNKSQLLKYIMRKSQELPAWDFFAQKRGFLNIGRIPYNK